MAAIWKYQKTTCFGVMYSTISVEVFLTPRKSWREKQTPRESCRGFVALPLHFYSVEALTLHENRVKEKQTPCESCRGSVVLPLHFYSVEALHVNRVEEKLLTLRLKK